MILTVLLILALVAFGLVVAAAVTPRVPLWLGVLFLAIIALLERLPLRLVALFFAVAALAACSETDLANAITSYGPEIIGTAFAAVAAYVARFAVNHVWLGGMLARLVTEARAAVAEVEQTYVDKITEGRADGTLTAGESMAARAAAIAALKGNLGRKGLQRLGRVLGLTDAEIDRLLGTHVEAAVKALSIAAPADKIKITVADVAAVQPPGADEPVKEKPPMNPAIAHVLQFFKYDHLPPGLQEVSKPFSDLAEIVANSASNAEVTVALRKLLEAKDAAVRAKLVA